MIKKLFAMSLGMLVALPGFTDESTTVVIKLDGARCSEDPNCINRLHPAIPMNVRARPGDVIVFETRDTADGQADPALASHNVNALRVHPLTGPVYVEGAERGDVLAITIIDVAPGPYGFTSNAPIGFIGDLFTERTTIHWKLDRLAAVSDAIPGVRIPYGAFPGVVTVLPGVDEVITIRDREMATLQAGGAAPPPAPEDAVPTLICGPNGTHKAECLRTIPPREHGGNLDIKYMTNGITVLLPCHLDGCGLAIGDVHYAQGDGEVAGTAIEMGAVVTVKIDVRKGMGRFITQPQYEGIRSVREPTATRFYATTGIPIKNIGEVPPNMAYLESPKVAGLANLSKDVSLSARNALIDMIDYMVREHGLTRLQAYLVASVAVDIRIGQLVDGSNVGATAILPLDIFVDDQ